LKNIDITFWVLWLWNTNYVDSCISCLVLYNSLI
jgi:hypothetical protein